MNIKAPDIIDSELSYVALTVVDSWWYGNSKSKLTRYFGQYLVGLEGYGLQENWGETFEMVEGTDMQSLVNLEERYLSDSRDHQDIKILIHGTKKGS